MSTEILSLIGALVGYLIGFFSMTWAMSRRGHNRR